MSIMKALKQPQEEIADALERIIAGPEKKGAVMNDKKRKLVAYHEVRWLEVGGWRLRHGLCMGRAACVPNPKLQGACSHC